MCLLIMTTSAAAGAWGGVDEEAELLLPFIPEIRQAESRRSLQAIFG